MPSKRRHTLSVSSRFYDRLSRFCAERDLPVAQLVSDVINAAMEQPYVERPLPERPDGVPHPRPLTPRAAVYTCSACGQRGHNAASHAEPGYVIDVSSEIYELLSDLRIRARELEGRDVTHAELLEQGIERALVAQNHQHERDRA